MHYLYSFFFFFNDTATTEIYTLSLHDALPILNSLRKQDRHPLKTACKSISSAETWVTSPSPTNLTAMLPDRKSTRLNSSHSQISYAVFCLKKKKKQKVQS